MKRKIGQRVVRLAKNSKACFKQLCDYVYEIPLLSSLKQLLSDPFILDEVHVATHNIFKKYNLFIYMTVYLVGTERASTP